MRTTVRTLPNVSTIGVAGLFRRAFQIPAGRRTACFRHLRALPVQLRPVPGGSRRARL
jgi:hypothetical protein